MLFQEGMNYTATYRGSVRITGSAKVALGEQSSVATQTFPSQLTEATLPRHTPSGKFRDKNGVIHRCAGTKFVPIHYFHRLKSYRSTTRNQCINSCELRIYPSYFDLICESIALAALSEC